MTVMSFGTKSGLSELGDRLARRSLRMLLGADLRLGLFALFWMCLGGLAVAGRLAFTAQVTGLSPAWLMSVAVYALILLTPVIGVVLARHAFPADVVYAVPRVNLAPVGRWRAVDPLSARAHPHFGPGGMVAGLAIGLLLNIVVRTGEFMAAVPALAAVVDGWAYSIYLALAADCLIFNLLYAVVFVMAVRNIPWFPRMLMLVWLMDIVSQLLMAQTLGGIALPPHVAEAMAKVLTNNVDKTLISVALWTPYLLLSERVNVTYRRRVAVPAVQG